MDKVTAAKVGMYEALLAMVNKGEWVRWPDGVQYFVILPEDFRAIMDPYEVLLEAEDEAEKSGSSGPLR